jgi:hypothetical protein
MRVVRLIGPVVVAGGVAVAIAGAPAAFADPLLPSCESTGGDSVSGGQNTECASPGNVQIDATPPVYPYPFYDEFYGPGFVI